MRLVLTDVRSEGGFNERRIGWLRAFPPFSRSARIVEAISPRQYRHDDEEDGGSYIPGPDDPDYDLSEAAGYAGWQPSRQAGVFPQWVIVAVSLLLILAILTPLILRLS